MIYQVNQHFLNNLIFKNVICKARNCKYYEYFYKETLLKVDIQIKENSKTVFNNSWEIIRKL